MILLIDNYDSFTYNLYQLIGTLQPDIVTIRNDAKTVDEIIQMHPQAVILSPGPGKPADAGVCEDVVKALGGKIPMLGVCLGHQAICEAYGGTVGHAAQLMHGKQSMATLDHSCRLFDGLPDQIPVARYHSLSLQEKTLPECLQIVSRADDGEVMAVQHRTYSVYGLQFHPESIMTPDGMIILKNFLKTGKM